MADSGKPMKVYDLIEQRRSSHGRVYPASAYRAMEFLEGAGLVRRIETLSAYVLCCDRAATASAPLFICERCHEVHDAPAGAGPAATPEGLRVVRSVAEHYGLCAACSGAAGAPLEAS